MSNPHFEPPHSSTTLPETPSLTHSPSFDPLPLSSFAIKSTNVFLEESQDPCEAIILIQNGQIHDIILPSEASPELLTELYLQWKVEDYGDLVIFPGLVDSNVHLHANYDDDWENIAYCTNLAAAGGVTTIIDNPIMTSPYKNAEEYVKSLQEKIDKIQSISKVDFGIYGLLEPKTKNHIAEILQTGALGLKCYLLRNFQNGINHIAPEMVPNLIKDLDKKHPETLVVFHPETATERELFLTSPCRTEPLDKRVDMDYDIKSISQTGAANKGSYLDEYNNSKNDNDDDSDEGDEGLISPNSPTKLKGRILKLKEKTDVKDIVHFELLSYSKDNIDSHPESSSDSDKDFFEKLGQQSDGSRTQIGSESPERNSESPENNDDAGSVGNFGEVALFMVRNNSSLGKSSPIKKSRFARLKGGEDSETGKSPESDGNMGSLFNKLLKLQTENQEDEEAKSQGESPNLQEIEKVPILRVTKSDRLEAPDIFLRGETSQKLLPGPAHKLKNNKLSLDLPEEPIHKKISPRPTEAPEGPLIKLPPLEFSSPAGSDRESLQCLEGGRGSQASIGKTLKDDDDAPAGSEPAERSRMKAPRRASKFLTVIVNNANTEKTKSTTASPELKKTSSSLLQLQQAPQSAGFKPLIQIGRPGNAGFRLQSLERNNSLLNPNNESQSRSPDSNRSPTSHDRPVTPMSNLLQRRALSRQSSCNTSAVSSPTAIRTFARFGSDIKGLDSPPNKEGKFNQNYKTFLANRPQNWEENAVSRVLNCFKKGNNLRIVFHNLSLASSFLKIRQKKKKSSHYKERIFGDTAPGYLFFNEKAVKDGETKFKTSPPFRNKENQRLLVETLRLGGVDTISSYHFFVPPQYKQIDDGNFRRAFCGTESMGSSLQATYTALFTYQQKNNEKFREDLEFQKEMTGKILKQAYKALCVTPAQMLKIGHRKGTIAKGKDADFVVWDPMKVDHNNSFKISHLFNGKPLLGLVHKTFLRGNLIYDKDGPGKVVKGYNVEFIRP